MYRQLLPLVLTLLYSSICNANYLVEGNYFTFNTSLHVILLNDDDGVVAASTTTVGGRDCSGTVAGLGKLIGQKIIVPLNEDGNKCDIIIEFDKTFTRAKITEKGVCDPYHGAACGWEGQTLKKLKEPKLSSGME